MNGEISLQEKMVACGGEDSEKRFGRGRIDKGTVIEVMARISRESRSWSKAAEEEK